MEGIQGHGVLFLEGGFVDRRGRPRRRVSGEGAEGTARAGTRPGAEEWRTGVSRRTKGMEWIGEDREDVPSRFYSDEVLRRDLEDPVWDHGYWKGTEWEQEVVVSVVRRLTTNGPPQGETYGLPTDETGGLRSLGPSCGS